MKKNGVTAEKLRTKRMRDGVKTIKTAKVKEGAH